MVSTSLHKTIIAIKGYVLHSNFSKIARNSIVRNVKFLFVSLNKNSTGKKKTVSGKLWLNKLSHDDDTSTAARVQVSIVSVFRKLQYYV